MVDLSAGGVASRSTTVRDGPAALAAAIARSSPAVFASNAGLGSERFPTRFSGCWAPDGPGSGAAETGVPVASSLAARDFPKSRGNRRDGLWLSSGAEPRTMTLSACDCVRIRPRRTSASLSRKYFAYQRFGARR